MKLRSLVWIALCSLLLLCAVGANALTFSDPGVVSTTAPEGEVPVLSTATPGTNMPMLTGAPVIFYAEPTPTPKPGSGTAQVFYADPTPTPQPVTDIEATPRPTPSYAYYTDDLTIEIVKHSIKNVTYFAIELQLTSIEQLRSAFSSARFDAAVERVADIAERENAIVAINGDYGTYNSGGIIIRNGELFRDNRSTRHLLTIDRNGDFVMTHKPDDKSKEQAASLMASGVWQTAVFGPILVQDGVAAALPREFFISTGAALEPRTAIGQLGPLHYLILVVDGRRDNYSQGVSLARLQELFLQHGAIAAFNLDGGGSTTLYFNGAVINRPGEGSQRRVSDIFFIEKVQ